MACPSSALSRSRRWWALAALVACNLLLGLDATVLNVALPSISAELGATGGQLQWMVNGYLVVLAALMLPGGLLGDRFGRRRVLVAGLGVFLGASLLGASAHTVWPVVVARALMGAGAALVMPLALSVLPSLFGPRERDRALGVVSAVSALGFPLGPLLGGWLVERFWWGSVFLVNVPLALAGIAACVFLLPESRDPASPRLDVTGAALTVAGLGALVLALNEGPARGWASPPILGAAAASAVLLAALVRRSRGRERPLLDLSLLRQPEFVWSTAAATLVSFVLAALMFALPQYLQDVRGYDGQGAGLAMLPLMAAMAAAPRLTGALTARFGPRAVIGGGLLTLSAATLLGAAVGQAGGYPALALWLALAGLGLGTAIVPAVGNALGALPTERAGSGSGLLTTLRQCGSALGVAVLGGILTSVYAARLDTDAVPAAQAVAARQSVAAAHLVADRLTDGRLAASADRAFTDGTRVLLAACAAAALTVALLVLRFLPAPAPAPAPAPRPGTTAPDRRTAER
ncbi:MFS transporter [Kitasatospora sp. NPDC059088]|uniref:MFS transporter n=1 Tax=Kitasatospora sp. NPDC059088 TaxID=3346722 RepID=UPI0036C4CE7A